MQRSTATQQPMPNDTTPTTADIVTMYHRELRKVEAQQRWIDTPHGDTNHGPNEQTRESEDTETKHHNAH
eukprot:11197151-Prorocentrum_lima.AAC.1